MIKATPVVRWTIKGPTNYLLTTTISFSRKEAIDRALYFNCEASNWKQLYNRGWRCVRLIISEV
jgi:hypothetical protein